MDRFLSRKSAGMMYFPMTSREAHVRGTFSVMILRFMSNYTGFATKRR